MSGTGLQEKNVQGNNVQEPSKAAVIGAAPEGASDPHSAARAVREMFTSIAPRYDLLNHVLSFNIDRIWWRRTARSFRHILVREDARILDLCCGTGDMTFALRRQGGKASPRISLTPCCNARWQSPRETNLILVGSNRVGSKPMPSVFHFPMRTSIL
jgi:hypothetical protein